LGEERKAAKRKEKRRRGRQVVGKEKNCWCLRPAVETAQAPKQPKQVDEF